MYIFSFLDVKLAFYVGNKGIKLWDVLKLPFLLIPGYLAVGLTFSINA